METKKEKSQEAIVKEAVEQARKAAVDAEREKREQTGAGEAETEKEEEEKAGEELTAEEETDMSGDADLEEKEAEGGGAGGDGEEAVSGEGPKAGKKLFGKKSKKDKKDEKIEELTDRLTRQMAEFDNFRKRTEREKSQMYEIGAKDIIEKILPVIDNFERGLGTVGEDKEDPFVQGMEMVYKQLMATLEGVGVRPIEAAGQEFNPDFHNAVMHVEDESLGANTIAEELQKGYIYRESVVRYSMVKVAN